MTQDRFGNPLAPGLPYARGQYIRSTADDYRKLQAAWGHMRNRWETLGPDSLYHLSGLDRGLDAEPDDLPFMDDEIAPFHFIEEVTRLGLEHLGGDPARHEVMVLNRVTAALLVSADVLIRPGDRVIGVSASHSHPAILRAVAHARGRFRDTTGLEEYRRAMEECDAVSAVFLTRLAVSYEILHLAELREIVRLARLKGAKVIVDDAGGARVGPAVFDQPRTLELGVDIGATGLDKYGASGPRLGLLAGDRALVEKIRARAYEMGLEARQLLYPAVARSLRDYRPERVRELVATTKTVAEALRRRIAGNRLFETPVTVQLRAEDILELAMERAGLETPPVVPFEASAGLAMLLLRDFGILTVHFAAIPPGTSALLIKFLPPATLARLGGPEKMAEAIDACLTLLGESLKDPEAFRALVLEGPS